MINSCNFKFTMVMRRAFISWILIVIECRSSQSQHPCPCASDVKTYNGTNNLFDKVLDDTDLSAAFVVFRHGDRTPNLGELKKLPHVHINASIFYPYGLGALTNQGKRRGYTLGEYLKKRYKNILSKLYLPSEISIRSTDTDRTKMTALVVLSAMFPPRKAQMWNFRLDWQPIPYSTRPLEDDDLTIYNSCPRFILLKNQVYALPEVYSTLKANEAFFKTLRKKTGFNYTKPSDVYFLRNLLKIMEEMGIERPDWANELMANITQIVNLEYLLQIYNKELIKLGSGVLIGEIVNASNMAIAGDKDQPKLRLYSAHDVTIANFLGALKVFEPHQPNYGASVSIELRKNCHSNKYGIMVVYSAQASGPGKVLIMPECGGEALCDYDRFVHIMEDVILTRSEFRTRCSTPL